MKKSDFNAKLFKSLRVLVSLGIFEKKMALFVNFSVLRSKA